MTGNGIVVMTGTAPDGSPLSVPVDVLLDDGEMCLAEYGTGLAACCTLHRDHPGPWHVATTETHIVKVWPLNTEKSNG
jgi:hypothetical protein